MANGAAMSYRYRCGQCRTTSPPVLTRHAVALERRQHRVLCHGGHIPDGERVVQPERFRFSELPREQRVFGTLMLAVLAVAFLVRFL